MRPIEGKLNSPYQKHEYRFLMSSDSDPKDAKKTTWERDNATVFKIRCSEGYPISTFRQLVDEVAQVTLSNKNNEMYYRGQTIDFKDSTAILYKKFTPKTIIYPSICRPDKNEYGSNKYSIRSTLINKRYKNLYDLIDISNIKGWNSNEYHFSLFQHYGITPTPMIDVTQSLRVAATFSLINSKSGYLYMFGLPYPYQSISYFNDLGIVLIKLQNVCPVEALRPRYQEGYLVGKFPIRPTKEAGDNLARRLVAKFKIDNENGKFWDQDFQPIPDIVLFPKDDIVESELKVLKEGFFNKSNT